MIQEWGIQTSRTAKPTKNPVIIRVRRGMQKITSRFLNTSTPRFKYFHRARVWAGVDLRKSVGQTIAHASVSVKLTTRGTRADTTMTSAD